jgi:hypothetical protein
MFFLKETLSPPTQSIARIANSATYTHISSNTKHKSGAVAIYGTLQTHIHPTIELEDNLAGFTSKCGEICYARTMVESFYHPS